MQLARFHLWLLGKLYHFGSYMTNMKVTINVKSTSEAQD